MTDEVNAGKILRRTMALLRQGAARAGATMIVLTLLSVAVDSGSVDKANADTLNLVQGGLTIAASYWITKSLLEALRGRTLPARFWGFFGLGLLSSIAILFGVVLLVIPGIVLAVRWSASAPILVDTDDGVIESLQHSWRLTGPAFWPILVALLAIWGPALLFGIVTFSLGDLMPGEILPIALSDFGFELGLVASWHAAVAIYVLLEPKDRLAETFA